MSFVWLCAVLGLIAVAFLHPLLTLLSFVMLCWLALQLMAHACAHAEKPAAVHVPTLKPIPVNGTAAAIGVVKLVAAFAAMMAYHYWRHHS